MLEIKLGIILILTAAIGFCAAATSKKTRKYVKHRTHKVRVEKKQKPSAPYYSPYTYTVEQDGSWRWVEPSPTPAPTATPPPKEVF